MENINFDNLATKDDIKLFRNDLKEELKNFATKEDLQEFSFELTKGNDKVIKELKIMREESASHSKSYKDNEEEIEKHEEVLDDHEKRINVLELQPAI